jgi:hypothetical protein
MRLMRGLVPSLSLLLVACAGGPLPAARDLRPGDLERLGGTWAWTERWHSPARLGTGPVKVRLADGRLQFESASAVGNLVLYEDAARRVLRGEGRDRSGGGTFRVELTQRSSAETRTAASGEMFVLVVVE